ncbi:RagB/SusD family nutrient uptake outer membrane protein [Hymenobacter sp. BT664]|uniref:RagB/SusD family nutrient uptake outer membrane protein n=1 Tax=Hymenobacter montanus TaxID=2771359 RepID=A0A927GJ76_9BACT|nr:RagB/SusD family nutrient uptake outer membrane protein [Hymenobacter montanus]MBD2768203.1 RagB/SusD family nutrient uptake outer membrane protein [Hymenobacter montanus]
MKKTLQYLALAVVLAAGPLAGCNSKLDVEPVDYVLTEKALLTSADVEAALIGSYSLMSGNRVYGGYIQFIADLLGANGEIAFVGTAVQPREFIQKTTLVNNTFSAGTWTDSYQAINTTNNVLANLDKVVAVRKDRVEGEARFIRAALYFELVRLFGRDWSDGNPQTNLGVPLVFAPTVRIDAASQVSRNTVSEVYAQVLSDLTIAKAKLPASNGFFATKGAASAMLARVYLQQGRYAEARDAASDALAGNRYPLVPSFKDEFATTTNTSEDIFAIQITAQDGLNDLNTYYSSSQRGDIEVDTSFIKVYDANDERGKLFKDKTYTLKYEQQYGNIKVIRSAEMHLIRAECNARLETEEGATPLSDVNTVRNRAGAPALTTVNLTNVLAERRLELAFEGFRIHDAKRLKENVGSLPYNSPRLVLPIPQRERDVNPNLVQNPGYL